MIADAEIRDRYLSLALDARKIIDDLVVFVEEGRRPQDFQPRLQDAVESLRRASGERNIFAPLRNNLPLEHYEQIRTVEEVTNAAAPGGKVIDDLSQILDETADPEARKNSAFDAIEFFYALERRALHNYNQQTGPEGT
jgi:hypothetical protein